MNNIEEKKIMMQDIKLDDRPREKLISRGREALELAEILAIIIGTGTTNYSAIDLSKEILKRFNNLNGYASLKVEDLTEISGIGKAKACQIIAALELARRLTGPSSLYEAESLNDPKKVYRAYRNEFMNEPQEKFIALALDTKLKLIKIIEVSKGTVNSTQVHPRDVFRDLVKCNASSCILIHNHPSGDSSPSHEDKLLTNRLVECSKIIGISILDHLIIGDTFFSFKEHNLMEWYNEFY